MPSERYLQLKEQIDSLRSHLLPTHFDSTGIYEDQNGVTTRALAFRVLAHAEIESFFEDRALEAVDGARAAWDRGKYVSRIAFCLLGFSGKEMARPPDTIEAPSDNKRKAWPALVDIGERFRPTLSAFHHMVRNENHGIKEKNLLSLLLPIGIDHQNIDPAFLADMDSFGTLRGVAAHSSRRTTATQGIDPSEEWKRVDSLMQGIASLDTEIEILIVELPTLSEDDGISVVSQTADDGPSV
jgi:hypothetical protein